MDALTDFLNPEQLDAWAENYGEEWSIKQEPRVISVVVFDIDAFSRINNETGYQNGDEYLSKIAHVISNEVLAYSGTGYRTGGEEFTVIIPNAILDEARKFTLSVQEKIALLSLPMGAATSGLSDNHEIFLTISAALTVIYSPFYGDILSVIKNTHFAIRARKYVLSKSNKNMAQVLVCMVLKSHEG
ncbi:MAG: hypothetical protein B7Y56_15885 [Gallionellales bacterium 35-53-114]|jgi:diguanylate cyclase (GGDEF)-like protein|nr:MAG: hypothetical protein B7Y56_15885 [Gallionellales bacterium 35-53-114]HQS60020.1 diguanylate cyclase [Gallionellaceae bacterium]